MLAKMLSLVYIACLM